MGDARVADLRRQDALAHLHLMARARHAPDPAEAGVTLSVPTIGGQLIVRGDPADLAFRNACVGAFGFVPPAEPNTVIADGAWTTFWLGPDEWLSLTGPGQAGLLTQALDAFVGRVPSPIDVSDARVAIRLAGHRASDVLARLCPLDLAADTMATGRCARSLLGRIDALIHVRAGLGDAGGAYDIYVGRSFADYAWRVLEDAGQAHGVAIDAG